MEAAHRFTVDTFKSRGAVSQYIIANSQVYTISYRQDNCQPAVVFGISYCLLSQDVVFKLEMVRIVF